MGHECSYVTLAYVCSGRKGNCLCELGTFGIILSDGTDLSSEVTEDPGLPPVPHTTRSEAAAAAGAMAGAMAEAVSGSGRDPPNVNKYAGYLLRVKPSHALEGGVAAGYAVLSCPALVDE